MTIPTIGVDCDITLSHPLVNGGDPVGFLLNNLSPTGQGEKHSYGPKVDVHFETYTNALGVNETLRHLWFYVLIADGLINPDGSLHSETAANMRNFLIDMITKNADITLTTYAGAIAGLYSTGHIMIDAIFQAIEVVEVQLTTRSTQFAPVDPTAYYDSMWVDLTTYAGVRTWDNSYWR